MLAYDKKQIGRIHRILIPAFRGSNPRTPATLKKLASASFLLFCVYSMPNTMLTRLILTKSDATLPRLIRPTVGMHPAML